MYPSLHHIRNVALVLSIASLVGCGKSGKVTAPPAVAANWSHTSGPTGGNITTMAASGGYIFAGALAGIWDQGGVSPGSAFNDDGNFLSSDNGATWTRVTPGGAYGATANAFVVSGGDLLLGVSENPLLGSARAGVYRSSNAGASWTQIKSGLPADPSVTCLAATGAYVVAGTPLSGLYRSADNGATWTQVAGASASNVSVAACLGASGANVVAATSAGLYHSGDNGASWVRADTASTVSCMTASGTGLYAVTSTGGVYRSGDNGATWTRVSSGLPAHVQSLVPGGASLFAAAGGLFRSDDNGASWVQVASGLPPAAVVVCLTASGPSMFAGMAGGGSYRSDDNGASWIEVNRGLSYLNVSSLAFKGTTLFAGCMGGGVYRSDDNGASWKRVSAGLNSGFVRALAVSGADVYARMNASSGPYVQGGVFRTSDDGASWNVVLGSSDSYQTNDIAAVGASVFASRDRRLLRSDNAGATWTDVTPDSVSVSAMAGSGTTLFAGGTIWTGWYGICRSIDNGASWARSGQLGDNVTSIAAGGSVVLAGMANHGIYRSIDNGATWSHVTNGLPANLSVLSMAVSGNRAFAGTVGQGLYGSSDSGASWTLIGYPREGVYYYPDIPALAVSGTSLFAGMQGATGAGFTGVWRMPF